MKDACEKDADCWQVPFSKMTMLDAKKDTVNGSKLIFFHLVRIICM